MSFDYDMFVIDSTNKDTTEYQLRDCIKDALEQLNKRLEEQEKLMEVMTDHLDTQSRLNTNYYSEIAFLKDQIKLLHHYHKDSRGRIDNLQNHLEKGDQLKTSKCMDEESKKPTIRDVVNHTEAGKAAVRKALELSCKEQEEMAKKAEAIIEQEHLSLCDGCSCMTKTKDNKCRKCGKEKK